MTLFQPFPINEPNGEPAVCFSAHGFGQYDDMNAVGTLMCGQNETVRGDTPLVVHKNYIDAEMEIRVRKYPVDTDRLKKVLKDHKSLSAKEYAAKLNKPITLVEHWFRQDDSFAIPDADVWYQLKELLGIDTEEFDESITVFETKGGNYDNRNRIYIGDTAPTMKCSSGNDLYLLPIVQPFRKTSHPRTEDEPQGWEEADKNDTLNIFDNSEMRTPTVIVSMDRETFNAGQNFAQNPGIREDGIQPTLVARGPGGVCYTIQSTPSDMTLGQQDYPKTE